MGTNEKGNIPLAVSYVDKFMLALKVGMEQRSAKRGKHGEGRTGPGEGKCCAWFSAKIEFKCEWESTTCMFDKYNIWYMTAPMYRQIVRRTKNLPDFANTEMNPTITSKEISSLQNP